MKKIISFDISSSTIGWAEFELDNSVAKLIDTGHIKPPKSKFSISKRLSDTLTTIDNFLKLKNPDEVVVEDYAKRFTAGRSTAKVIIILSVFNELISLSCFRYTKKDVYRYPVVTIRAALSKIFSTKIVSKDDVMPILAKNCLSFNVKQNKKGFTKKESFDEADAIAVGLTHIFKTEKNITWNL